MKEKRIYYRRKGKALIIEGKEDDKSVLIWTLPNAETLINGILEKASFFTQEKEDKIREKLRRLDTKERKDTKAPEEVRLMEINTTPKKDAELPKIDEATLKKLYELTR